MQNCKNHEQASTFPVKRFCRPKQLTKNRALKQFRVSSLQDTNDVKLSCNHSSAMLKYLALITYDNYFELCLQVFKKHVRVCTWWTYTTTCIWWQLVRHQSSCPFISTCDLLPALNIVSHYGHNGTQRLYKLVFSMASFYAQCGVNEGPYTHQGMTMCKNHNMRTLPFDTHKNVLQFLLLSAHGRIPCNLVSKYPVHLAVHQGAGGMLVICRTFPQTHETAPLFLYKHVILATHSYH